MSMSGILQIGPSQIGSFVKSTLASLVLIRTATKRAAGSRTNKNDSAGRRLGPKAYENNFVKPGQIIMRQKGTKIHPGENVGIGRDFTIFALEPGYVRFYMDPFHPLRKFVGVALKKELQLPTAHFSPRIRRFGYVPLEGEQAEIEEARMSRKETLDQPRLKAAAEKQAQKGAKQLNSILASVSDICPEYTPEQQGFIAQRLQFIYQRQKHEDNLPANQAQGTFNFTFDLELAFRRGEVSEDEMKSKKSALIDLFNDADAKIAVDFTGAVHGTYSAEIKAQKADDIMRALQEFKNKILTAEAKEKVESLINEPGVFSRGERNKLMTEYLPKVLPETVPGTVIDPSKTKKVPKNAVTQRIFNPQDRTLRTVIRTKEAFLA